MFSVVVLEDKIYYSLKSKAESSGKFFRYLLVYIDFVIQKNCEEHFQLSTSAYSLIV